MPDQTLANLWDIAATTRFINFSVALVSVLERACSADQ